VSLKERITDDMKAAMRAGEKERLGIIRMITAAIKQQIWTVDKGLPVYDVLRMQDILDDSVSQRRFSSVLLSIFGGLGILLACLGIYGALTFNVVQRTREIGIRMALGAQQQNLTRMFVRHGLILAGIGVACGIVAAIPLMSLMTSLLFRVKPVDPVTYAAVSGGLVLTAFLASYLPSRRVAEVNPVEALRAE